MPVLSDFINTLQKEFGSDFSKLPNRHSTLLVIVQHGFASIQPLMESVLELGIDPKQIIKTTKPHTTSPEMLNYFHQRFGKNYLAFQWPTIKNKEKEEVDQTPYQIASEATHEALLEKVCHYLLHYPAPPEIKNIIVCDEGGKFLKEFINRYQNPDSRYTKKLSDYQVVAIEHTKCGTYSEALGRLPFPMVNMADSFIKTQVESKFIAKSMITSLKSIFTTISDISNATIGVIGGGNIGEEVLRILQQKYPKTSIIFYDQENGVLPISKLREKGLSHVIRVHSAEEFYKRSGIILGCTGKNVTHASVFKRDWLKENSHPHIHFISCSSGDREFYSLLQKMPRYQLKNVEDIHAWHMEVSPETKQILTIHNGGFPINFLVNQPENIPLHEIQITRTMKLAAIVQAFTLLEIMVYQLNQERYVKLDENYQYTIIQSFHKNQIKRLIQREEATGSNQEGEREYYSQQYRYITKDKISQSSIGVKQLELNDVVSIPFYVKTNYQIELEQKMDAQRTLIKRIAITGTAGSGKTVLGRYYLNRYKKQYPLHLTRILIAETKEQWQNNLRIWAMDLDPRTNEFFKVETNPERQHAKVLAVLQEAVSRISWCILVDNWDINTGPSIHEITNLFFQAQSGTLLLTTQAPSPFRTTCSLNLSKGFSSEESHILLKKVMNLSKELGLKEEVLGSNSNCHALLTQLNHLPLAIVQAGSYILEINKERYSLGDVYFTYFDYQKLLQEQINEIIQKYEAVSKNIADVPLVTQQAAIYLSLSRAIQPASDFPDMILWISLCFCGFLAPTAIPQKILKILLQQLSQKSSIDDIDTLFTSVLKGATQYSLLQLSQHHSPVDKKPSLLFHRVTQHVLRNHYWPMFVERMDKQLSKPGQAIPILYNMQVILWKLLEDAVLSSDYASLQDLLSHAEAWPLHQYNATSSLFSRSELIIQNMFFQQILARANCELGNYTKAKKILEEVLVSVMACRETKTHVDIARTQDILAGILESLGDYEAARILCETALANKIAHYGTKLHIDVAKTQQNLANIILNGSGKYLQAKELYEKAMATMVTHYGTETHIDVAIIQHNLALVLREIGDYSAAKHLYENVLATELAYYGTEAHVSIARTQGDLGNVLQELGDYIEAKKLQEKALATKTAHYGTEKRIEIAKIQQSLANTLHMLGEYPKAKILYETALETAIAHYGTENNIVVAIMQQDLSSTLEELGVVPPAATILCKKALETAVSHYGTETHIRVAMIQDNLANALQKQGNYHAAKVLYQKALQSKISHYGMDTHVDVARSQQNLAGTLLKLGDYWIAKELQEKALATNITHFGTEEHLQVAFSRCNLSIIHMGLENYQQASSLIILAERTFMSQPGGSQYLELCANVKNYLKKNMPNNLSGNNFFSSVRLAGKNEADNTSKPKV